MNLSPFLKQWMEEAEAERAARKELVLNLTPAYLKWKEEILNEGKQQGIQLGKEEAVPILAELGLSAVDIVQHLGLPATLAREIL